MLLHNVAGQEQIQHYAVVRDLSICPAWNENSLGRFGILPMSSREGYMHGVIVHKHEFVIYFEDRSVYTQNVEIRNR